MKPRTRILAPIGLLVGMSSLLLAGPKKTFDHKQHIEEGAECSNCHQADGSLIKDACNECHDEGPPPWNPPARARRLNVKFPHKAHAESGECQQCHQKTLDGSQATGAPMVEQSGCVACHEENGVEVAEGDCSRCHGEDPRRTAPTDHQQAWLARHGREAQWRVFDRHGQDCATCHRSDVCQTCHKTRKPRSHTALWRMRTHGLSAAFDHQTCKACHQTGTCVRCHRSTAPLNHKGAWKSTHGLAAQVRDNQHCAVCHSLSWCAACHAGM